MKKDSLAGYVRLYYWYLRANWLALMAYPAEFVITNLAGVAYSMGSVAAVWVLFSQVKAIGDWGYAEVLLIYGLSIFARCLFHLFWVDLMNVGGMIRTGDIDRILVRPKNHLFQVVAGYLDNDDWGELVTAIILVWTSLGMLGRRSLGCILWALLSAISGSIILVSFHIVGNAMAFFVIEASGFTTLAWTMDEFTRYPIDIYGKRIGTILTWVLPVAFVSFFPAQAIIDGGLLSPRSLLSPLVAAITFTLAYVFWTKAMDCYQGVGH